MGSQSNRTRRDFLLAGTTTGAALLAAGRMASSAAGAGEKNEKPGAEGVSPAEDLTREHGVLRRVLLIYDEAARRLRGGKDFDPVALSSAAKLIRSVIEDYHEKLEEDHLFPRFEKAGKLTELVRVLRQQHEAGRRLTAEIIDLAGPQLNKEAEGRRKLVPLLRQFGRMYRPHAAREDTVLFPALHTIVSPKEYDALGDKFEDIEHEKLGAEGFEKAVETVASIEKKTGLYDLAQFTP